MSAGDMGKSDLFTLYLNYGGTFRNVNGVTDYVGGQLLNKWGFDKDKFGYFDLVDEFEQLGYATWAGFWYRIPQTHDYMPIKDDTGVMDMLALIGGRCRFINVYLEEGKLFDEVEEEAIRTLSGKGNEEDVVVDAGKGKENGAVEKGKQKEVLVENNYESDYDSDFCFASDEDGSHVSLDDLEFITDDEFAQAKKNIREEKAKSVFDLLDNFPDIDQLDLGKPHLSDYEDSDGPYQSSETDEDDPTVRKRKNRLYYDPKCDHKDMQIVLGMHFQDGFQCRDALKTWAIENARFIRFRKVSKVRCEAFCTPPCPWRINASTVAATGKFLIKRYYGDHECPKAMSNKLVSSKWIARRFLPAFRLKYNTLVADLRADILLKFRCYVPKDRLYKAKYIAQEIVRGTVEAHYGSLRRYLAELRRVDGDGRFELLLGDDHVFKGLYIGFSALRKGFLAGCRPFIGLDGCHLKTYMGGILLCAVGKDGNNQMFPIAWAVVETENEECWRWFLNLIIYEFGITAEKHWIFMSDQQKGLINAVSRLAPFVEHRNCARHIYGNFKKHFKGQTLQNLFWRVVYSTFVAEYRAALQEMKQEDPNAYKNFIERDTSKFCKTFISAHTCCDIVENNISECFNGWITEARGKHIIQMLEDIRSALMERQVEKVAQLRKVKDRICPRIRIKLEENRRDSIHCRPVPALYHKFEVHCGADTFSISKNECTCTCRYWQLSGIPCAHAVAAIQYVEEDPTYYVHECYTVKKVLEAYMFGLEPLNGERMWPEVEGFTVKPPLIRAQPGRPKKKRIRGPEERVSGKLSKHGCVMTCSRCGQKGHNKAGCKNAPVEKPVVEKRKRGRPAKAKETGNEVAAADKGKGKQAQSKGKHQATRGKEAAQRLHRRRANGIFINENSGNTSLHRTPSNGGMAHFTRFRRSNEAPSSSGSGVVFSATQGSSSASQVFQKPSDSSAK